MRSTKYESPNLNLSKAFDKLVAVEVSPNIWEVTKPRDSSSVCTIKFSERDGERWPYTCFWSGCPEKGVAIAAPHEKPSWIVANILFGKFKNSYVICKPCSSC